MKIIRWQLIYLCLWLVIFVVMILTTGSDNAVTKAIGSCILAVLVVWLLVVDEVRQVRR